MKSRLADNYYEWLCNLIDVEQEGASYWKLTNDMQSKPFYWTVPNDDNRAYDGKLLRTDFCDAMDIEYNYDDFDQETSMLELIIGVAYRCESITIQHGRGFKMIDWFWRLLDNCGLGKCTDDNYDEEYVCCTLEAIIKRTYKRDGYGGLFPLKKANQDQRKIEIWYQMHAYLNENYYN
jgi:hypothetical protein